MGPLLALGVANAGIQLLSRLWGKNQAQTQKEHESARLDAEFKKQADMLRYGYKNVQDTQLGATSIDPEAQYAKDAIERQSANATARGLRTATNSNEALSMGSGILANHINQIAKITASEGARRKAAAEAAAKTGLASQQALVQLDQQKQQAKRGAYADVNQSLAADTDFLSSLTGDVAAGALYEKAYGDGSLLGGKKTATV